MENGIGKNRHPIDRHRCDLMPIFGRVPLSKIYYISTMVKQECQSAILSPQVFEPSECEKGMLTSKDNEIRNADVPERFQVGCESNNRLLFL